MAAEASIVSGGVDGSQSRSREGAKGKRVISKMNFCFVGVVFVFEGCVVSEML